LKTFLKHEKKKKTSAIGYTIYGVNLPRLLVSIIVSIMLDSYISF